LLVLMLTLFAAAAARSVLGAGGMVEGAGGVDRGTKALP